MRWMGFSPRLCSWLVLDNKFSWIQVWILLTLLQNKMWLEGFMWQFILWLRSNRKRIQSHKSILVCSLCKYSWALDSVFTVYLFVVVFGSISVCLQCSVPIFTLFSL
jgi:hypothetical protein